MDKFIEITDIGGDKMLINAAHVVCVEEYKKENDEFRYTQIALVGGHTRITYERYEEVKKKIENAGKVFVTQHLGRWIGDQNEQRKTGGA